MLIRVTVWNESQRRKAYSQCVKRISDPIRAEYAVHKAAHSTRPLLYKDGCGFQAALSDFEEVKQGNCNISSSALSLKLMLFSALHVLGLLN